MDLMQKKLDLEITEGYFVQEIVNGSGAEKGGVKSGDIIVQIDDVKIKSFSDLNGYLRSKQPGQIVEVNVMRNDNLLKIPVKLTKDEETYALKLGITLEDMTPEELEKNNLENGVRINKINNSELLNYGVKSGFIITKVNNVAVKTSNDVNRIIAERVSGEVIRIEMINLRGEKERYIFN